MTWFKVDDGFYDHPKVENLSMAARGLWVTAGSWCAKQLTDGVISKKKLGSLAAPRHRSGGLSMRGYGSILMTIPELFAMHFVIGWTCNPRVNR